MEVAAFEDLQVETEGETTVLVNTIAEGPVQGVVLGVSTCAFVLFVIVVVPFFNPTPLGTTLWILGGIVVLAAVAFLAQTQARTTKIRIATPSLQIEQGSALDREHISIAWPEIVAIELEPVDAKRGDKGMQLRVLVREGLPIDTLPGVSIGALTEARRLIVERLQQSRVATPA